MNCGVLCLSAAGIGAARCCSHKRAALAGRAGAALCVTLFALFCTAAAVYASVLWLAVASGTLLNLASGIVRLPISASWHRHSPAKEGPRVGGAYVSQPGTWTYIPPWEAASSAQQKLFRRRRACAFIPAAYKAAGASVKVKDGEREHTASQKAHPPCRGGAALLSMEKLGFAFRLEAHRTAST